MRLLFLTLAWLTPAVIAGISAWSGIWGTGSAFVDYLIPIPLAGGVFHVPSFLVLTLIIVNLKHPTTSNARYVSLFAIVIFLAAVSLQLDFDRLNAWLLTDYKPSGSPLRFGENPLYLFVATDAFWLGLYAYIRGYSVTGYQCLAFPLVPLLLISANLIGYQVSGPRFEIGLASPGKYRGQEIRYMYTSSSYDEQLFLNWLEEKNFSFEPWTNTNTEHVAVVFTSSLDNMKWGRFDEINADNTVATFCFYEEDRAIIPYSGYYDCFTERRPVEQQVSDLVAQDDSGFASDIQYWFARVILCEGVDISADNYLNIALPGMCRGQVNSFQRSLQRFSDKYGDDSPELEFVMSQASRLADNIPQ